MAGDELGSASLDMGDVSPGGLPARAGAGAGPSALARARLRFERGDMAGATTLAREAARSDPSSTEALILWGVAALEAGSPLEAISPLRRALARGSGEGVRAVLARITLGRALIASGRWRDGLQLLRAQEADPPADPRLRQRLGIGYLGAGQPGEAAGHLRAAAAEAPDNPAIQADLAWTLAALGETESAEVHYERAIALAPDLGRAHAGLATVRRWSERDHHVDRLRAVLARSQVRESRAELGYALFKELDDLGEPSAAWAALAAANEAAWAAAPWSAEDDAALAERLIHHFPAAVFEKLGRPRGASRGSRPIFVVGLPRSGTTLVERILGAHSHVVGAGELPFFPVAFREAAGAAPGSPIAQALTRWPRRPDWRAAGASYRREIAALAGAAQFVVDKLPFNSHLAGAIRLALPEAVIVLVERDPMDVLWSAHRQPFQIGGWYGWTRRLKDLHAHAVHHRRLMDHWRLALGDGLVTVRYEALVTAPEREIPALLERCGLPLEDACMRPQDAPEPILTLSQAAARRPISTGAIGSWRRYAEPLAPLHVALQESGLLTED